MKEEAIRFETVICLKGTLPGKYFFEIMAGCEFICADGAADALLAMRIAPSIVIGDLDSISDEAKGRLGNIPVLCDPDQESNDFEKCLRFALEKGAKHILVAGFNGGLIEHTLNNWSVLMKYHSQAHIAVYHEGRYGFMTSGTLRLHTAPGEKISLLPMYEPTITTSGLLWELKGEQLGFGKREGLSNRATGEETEINVENGWLMVFCDAVLPYVKEGQ